LSWVASNFLDKAAVGLYHEHSFILVNEMLRVLTAVKKVRGHCVTTLFAEHCNFDHDPAVTAANPLVDVMVQSIGELLSFEFPALLSASNCFEFHFPKS
jgi:hypothetical protein